jgi:hypothetical protein
LKENFLYYCKVCGVLDAEGISGHASNRCKVASNTASNIEYASNKGGSDASNRNMREMRSENAGARPKVVDAVPALLARVDEAAKRALVSEAGEHCHPAIKQRWSREKYNAYQRDYMRRCRAKALKGG